MRKRRAKRLKEIRSENLKKAHNMATLKKTSSAFKASQNGRHIADPIGDSRRSIFIKMLDKSTRVEVTTWEANFLEANLDRTEFTELQRKIVDEMRMRYEVKL